MFTYKEVINTRCGGGVLMNDKNRSLRLGMHTYTLHFFGFGESWGFGKGYDFV